MEVTIIFPHQLFQHHPALQPGRQVLLIEEWLFFHQYNFHKQKLMLHRATMQFYKDYLTANHYVVEYIPATDSRNGIAEAVQWLADTGCTVIHYADVADDWLEQRLKQAALQCGITVHVYTTPAFLNSNDENQIYMRGKRRYFQTDYYTFQRKRFKLLVEGTRPVGGRWSYDDENRQKLPKGEVLPNYAFTTANKYHQEATTYIHQHFAKNYGSADAPFGNQLFKGYYPATFDEANDWLQDFLQHRFTKFGVYEDAMVTSETILYHSVLSPLINTGLLLPKDVIARAMEAASKFHVPINSVEGFIRQVIGWREFIRMVYTQQGRKQRSRNYWGFTRKIPASFWSGTTGIDPIDAVIKRVLQSGYAHHIERLMVLGNFMLLCEFDPHDVYRWFMEMFVDAYDWVMVPNTYGMTQYADGGLMTTKPYISSSNYIKKMSNYSTGEWQEIWDALFWRFMHVHRQLFISNTRLSLLINSFDKWSNDKKQAYLSRAESYLQHLDEEQ